MDDIFDGKTIVFMFQDEDVEFGFKKTVYEDEPIEDTEFGVKKTVYENEPIEDTENITIHYNTFCGKTIKSIEELIDYLEGKATETLEVAKIIEEDEWFEMWVRNIGYGAIFDEVNKREEIL